MNKGVKSDKAKNPEEKTVGKGQARKGKKKCRRSHANFKWSGRMWRNLKEDRK